MRRAVIHLPVVAMDGEAGATVHFDPSVRLQIEAERPEVLVVDGRFNAVAPSREGAVAPDSGPDGLAGLTGTIAIDIVEGRHYYTFDYALGDA